MSPNRLLGVALLVVGLILVYFGWQATDSLGESIREGVTGNYSDRTTWYIVGGAVAILVGATLAAVGPKTRPA